MTRPSAFGSGPFSVRVDVAAQRLDVMQGGLGVASYPVSTSRFGMGCEEGSYKTPGGSFVIAEKIGAGAPLGAVFRSRIPTGDISTGGGEGDLILSRILWLHGVGEENANTHNRHIYIHGTNHEDLIGTPASMGCVRMRNQDIAELFELVPEGTPLEIA